MPRFIKFVDLQGKKVGEKSAATMNRYLTVVSSFLNLGQEGNHGNSLKMIYKIFIEPVDFGVSRSLRL